MSRWRGPAAINAQLLWRTTFDLRSESTLNRRLVDTVGSLECSHVPNDARHLFERDTFYGRHAPEGPVMCPHPKLGCHGEGLIAMMSRLVDAVNKRRCNAFLPGGIRPMA